MSDLGQPARGTGAEERLSTTRAAVLGIIRHGGVSVLHDTMAFFLDRKSQQGRRITRGVSICNDQSMDVIPP